MKYCPYCGAGLATGAVSFCAECGKSLPDQAVAEPAHEEKKNTPKKKSACCKHKPKRKPPSADTGTETPMSQQEDGYDGYYDDVLPSDIGRQREGLDKELIKKVAIIAGVMLLIVGLCVVAMYLL